MRPNRGILNRSIRTSSELRSDSKTVAYELEMLFEVAREYQLLATGTSIALKNACVESFALHCRALIYFLYGHLDSIEVNGETVTLALMRRNDVLAVDFTAAWATGFTGPEHVLLVAKQKADKQVAHITTERRELNQPASERTSEWPMRDVICAILRAFREFILLADSNCFDPEAHRRMLELVESFLSYASLPTYIVEVEDSRDVELDALVCGRTDIRTISLVSVNSRDVSAGSPKD